MPCDLCNIPHVDGRMNCRNHYCILKGLSSIRLVLSTIHEDDLPPTLVGKICLRSLLVNLVHMANLDTDPIVPALSGIADFGDVLNAHGLVALLLDLLDGTNAVESPVDLLESGTPGLDEEEVDGDELNEKPTLEKKVEFPTALFDANRDDELRYGQADIGGDALDEQPVCADLETENLERVGYVQGDPNSIDQQRSMIVE